MAAVLLYTFTEDHSAYVKLQGDMLLERVVVQPKGVRSLPLTSSNVLSCDPLSAIFLIATVSSAKSILHKL